MNSLLTIVRCLAVLLTLSACQSTPKHTRSTSPDAAMIQTHTDPASGRLGWQGIVTNIDTIDGRPLNGYFDVALPPYYVDPGSHLVGVRLMGTHGWVAQGQIPLTARAGQSYTLKGVKVANGAWVEIYSAASSTPESIVPLGRGTAAPPSIYIPPSVYQVR